MGNYTFELREVVEKEFGMSMNDHLQALRKEIFSFPYEYFNESLREEFELDFIRNFYTREIGFETFGQFKLKLENWLSLNMPYYNELYRTEGMIKNPLINVDWTETRKTQRDIISEQKAKAEAEERANLQANEKSEGRNNSFTRDLESDTPDSRLQITTGNSGTGVIEYASQINENKNTSEGTTNNTSNSTSTNANSGTTEQSGNSQDKYTDEFHVKGTQGMKTESEMLALYRQTLLRITKQIFDEMNVLFMLVY